MCHPQNCGWLGIWSEAECAAGVWVALEVMGLQGRTFPSIHRPEGLDFRDLFGYRVLSQNGGAHESRREAGPPDVPGHGRPGGLATPASAHQRRRRPSPAQHPASAPIAWHPDVAAAHSHDQRVQLQLSLLPHAARPPHAAHTAQAGRAGAHLPGGTSARMVRRTLHHHRDSRAPGQDHGRSDPGAGAASRAPPFFRIHPCEAGSRRRNRRRSIGSPHWPAESRSTSRRPVAAVLCRSRRKRALPQLCRTTNGSDS